MDYEGMFSYFLTLCTCARTCCLADASTATFVIAQLQRTATAEQFAILAYCVMPDHAHVVVQGTTERAYLPRFLKRFKQVTAYHHRRQAGEPLWQAGYYEHIIRGSESLAAVLRYVFENPVRAGLATDAAMFPYSGSDLGTVAEVLFSLPDASPWRP